MTSNPLDVIQVRHEKEDATYKARCSCCTTPASHVDRGKLVAALRAVEALASEWAYKGEFGWGAWQSGDGPDPEGAVLDQASTELRQAIQQALDG